MMQLSIEDDTVRCAHVGGLVDTRASERWIRIDRVPVMVRGDLPGRSISGCPMVGATTKPCTTTLAVAGGCSSFVRVHGQTVALSTLSGLTDGVPPGTVLYGVTQIAQLWVRER